MSAVEYARTDPGVSISEISDIVGIHGAVDEAVQVDPDLRVGVSRLLPVYEDRDVSWFRDFQDWVGATQAEADGDSFPSLAEGLRELSEHVPRCRMRARRLFAIAVAARAFPEIGEPDSELAALARGALSVSTLAGKKDDKKAQALLDLLTDDESLLRPGDTTPGGRGLWWDNLVEAAYAQGLITDMTAMRPRPCAGRFVTVPGVGGLVAALETDFIIDDIDFDQATRFLEPTNWKKCMPFFWCEMKKLALRLPPGLFRYHEIVSTDCGNKARAAFTAETDLDFSFTWIPDANNPVACFTNYELSPGRPQPGDRIRVDDGTLLVSKTGAGPRPLRITTTKRIQFSYPFSSEALVLLMCAFGYADVAGDLLCCAATSPERSRNKKAAGTDFPGEPVTVELGRSPQGAEPATATSRKRRRPAQAGRKRAGAADGDRPQDAATAVSECIQECADAARSWSKRMAEGSYTAPDLMQDVASAWGRMLREGATALDLGFRGGGVAPSEDRPRRRRAR